jgi:hypothetical protein
MKILLVNSNPVVSRLTALSARKESVELDEIRDILELKKSDYNIVFVDSESYTIELSAVLKNSGIKRKVLFYTQDDKDKDKIFNFTILKPFLPSEVSAILREAKIEIDKEENLALSEKMKPKPKEEYLDLNELISAKTDDLAPINLKTKRKKDVKREEKKYIQKSEEKLLEELNASKSKIDNIKKSYDLAVEEELTVVNKKEKPEPKVDKSFLNIKERAIKPKPKPEPKVKEDEDIKLFELDDKDSSSDNSELFVLDTQDDNKEKDKILDFDVDSKNEVNFDEVKKEEAKPKKIKEESIKNTKILDEDEISNIKSLLNDEEEEVIDDNPPSIEPKKIEKKREVKKELKEKDCVETQPKVVKRVFKDTVGSLPIEELRQLLRGTKINITIEFPKEV